MCFSHANGSATTDATPERLVCVARDQDDPRVIYVAATDFHNPHVAIDCGGRRRLLDRPAIGGYMDRSLIPSGVPFGHSGSHGPGRIKVLVNEARTPAAVVAELWEATTRAKLRRGRRTAIASPLAA